MGIECLWMSTVIGVANQHFLMRIQRLPNNDEKKNGNN